MVWTRGLIIIRLYAGSFFGFMLGFRIAWGPAKSPLPFFIICGLCLFGMVYDLLRALLRREDVWGNPIPEK